MLSHERVWAAIDALASRHGMTASGLARKAGLDATSFNKSKRVSPEGRERWPSTESISKILKATGATLEDFLRLVEPSGSLRRSMIPLIGMEEAVTGKVFNDEGMPNEGPGWDEIEFPDFGQEKVFALEVTGDALAPLYRDGDVLIVSPTASTRKGDRVVVCTTSGAILAKELKRRSAKTLEMTSLAKDQEDQVIPAEEVSWSARIMWARQ
ncbi:helix-turn-helix transcriptional regulator [Microvirga terrae]|uniref:Helix-turn-helix transcriptional regulator n=1 Tax=Microvirga terrae TaxID=2740529 RepID=A0ABY5RPV9_9HYPH|nr:MULTISPECIES: helix-turn-helix transcriptional regulator [Microvirga]MBQ0820329.1 helix-turn-helix transcriptional regulator [Microvirga sp. HBU67558]UVF18944.1 helix-turn-helix transcriptional regulator [Microvirga terrae]